VSKPSILALESRAEPGRFHLIRKRVAITAAAIGVALSMLAPVAAHAETCLLVLTCKSPTPTPSPSSKPTSSPKPKPKPSAKPASSSSPSARDPILSGGVRPAVTWVLDTVGTARNTRHLLELLQRLKPAGQPLAQSDLQRGFGRFPVLGYVWYQNDYGAPRYVPFFSLHEGIDLFAVAGTPIVAVTDGVVAKVATGSIGGNAIWLAGDDGITYYYGHMQGYAPGMKAGKRVRVGEVIGYVGSSGATHGTYPHLHFEMSPGGTGRTVSPKPVLDAWLVSAEVNAVDAYARIIEHNQLNRVGAARWQTVFDLLREPAAPVVPLWPLALNPAGSSLGLQAAFDGLAWGMDVQDLNLHSGIASGEVAAPLAGAPMQGPAWLTLMPTPASGGSTLGATRFAAH
jgi:murein DD-endopeptidase MepM/ murein hydrolase activator NlpD